MDTAEIHAKAVIAAALITSHAVEVPRIPNSGERDDLGARRLRDLTDYVYEALTAPAPSLMRPTRDPIENPLGSTLSQE